MDIKDLRLQKGYTQEELANLTKLSTRTIQRIEKENKASKESLNKIANVFGYTYEELTEYLKKEDKQTITPNYDKKLLTFILVNILLFLINIITTPEHLWFIYPLIGWGIPFFIKKYRNK